MLVYDQPINPAKPEDRPAHERASAGFGVVELTRLLWQRKVMIAATALICACLAVAIGKSLTPKYLATSQLYVDPRELQLVDRELTPRAQDVSGLAMVVESQARLITSNSVLLQVIQDTHLDKDPEFGGESKGMMASLLGLFGIEPRSAAETKLGPMVALETLNRHINIKKTDRSFIVDIEVWSYDPAKAAALANALSNAYLAESKNSQSTAARRRTRRAARSPRPRHAAGHLRAPAAAILAGYSRRKTSESGGRLSRPRRQRTGPRTAHEDRRRSLAPALE